MSSSSLPGSSGLTSPSPSTSSPSPTPSSAFFPHEEPANSIFYLSHLMPTSRLASFPLPLLCVLSLSLLLLSFLFLPSLSSWVSSLFFSLLHLLLFIVLSVAFLVWWSQSSLLYMPAFMGRHALLRSPQHNAAGFQSPADVALPFSSHFIPTPDGCLLHCWLLLQPSSLTSPTLVFFHGNAGNIGFRLPNAKTLYAVCGLNVLMVEYRGYGNSSGTPSERGLKLDAEAAVRWLRQQRAVVDADNVFIFGRSLGGAVAVHVAASAAAPAASVRGLILENTFTSIDDMVVCILHRVLSPPAAAVRLLRLLLLLFMTSHWRTEAVVERVACPVLLISGEKDELVPPAQMRRLHDRLEARGRRPHWLPVKEGTHNDTYLRGGAEYWQAVRAFITQHSCSYPLRNATPAAAADVTAEQTQHSGASPP